MALWASPALLGDCKFGRGGGGGATAGRTADSGRGAAGARAEAGGDATRRDMLPGGTWERHLRSKVR